MVGVCTYEMEYHIWQKSLANVTNRVEFTKLNFYFFWLNLSIVANLSLPNAHKSDFPTKQ